MCRGRRDGRIGGTPEDAVLVFPPSRNSEWSGALTLIRQASCDILWDPLKRLDAPSESISPRSLKGILTGPFRVIFRFSVPGDLLSRVAGFPQRCIFSVLIFIIPSGTESVQDRAIFSRIGLGSV